MNSLFVKLTIWFFATLLVSFGAFLLTPLWFSPRATDPRSVFDSVHRMELELAVEAFERGGKAELAHFLDKLDQHLPRGHYLLDARGHDLLTGEDRSRSLSDALGQRAALDAKVSPGGRYALLLDLPPRAGPFSLIPYYLWIALLIVLMAWVFARYLLQPVFTLSRAVREFGAGNLTRRVNFRRQDAIGDLANDFDAMADRIVNLLTAERRLLQDISHELRSPLSRLSLAIEMNRCDDARQEIHRLSNLIGELAEMARAEGDPASLERAPVDLTATLKRISAHSDLNSDVEEELVCQGREALIQRAVENVVENAARHTPAGTKVELRAHREDRHVEVRIRDYGPGVPPDALEDIFRPFYRVERDRSRDSGGMGLGLAIAQRAVRLHNGRVHAINANPGLEVVISLPA